MTEHGLTDMEVGKTGLAGKDLLEHSRKCAELSSISIGMDGYESLSIHLLWNAIRLHLAHDCFCFLAGTPDADIELHDLAMHVYRHTGSDEYLTIARNLIPYDGLGKIFVETKRAKVRPYTHGQYSDLAEIYRRLLSMKR